MRKNSKVSFWALLATIYFAVLVFLLAGSILMGLLSGSIRGADLGGLLLQQIPGWILLVGFSAALWLRWKELRKIASFKQLLGWRALAALIVFGVIAAGPWWIPIHVQGGEVGLDVLMLGYAFYLFFAGLILLAPCFLIYSLGRVLAEKEMEQEELDEAKKY